MNIMRINVCGMDPSLTHWGLAEGMLDLTTGILDELTLTVIEPEKLTNKQVRQNSTDLFVADQLAKRAFLAAREAKAVFVEVPVGSQSARAMASYGVCVGVLGAMRAEGIQLIEVTATEVKKALTGCKTATKQQMIDRATELYPEANFPSHKGKLTAKTEHVADAIGTIHAGVNTPMFQNLLRLLNES